MDSTSVLLIGNIINVFITENKNNYYDITSVLLIGNIINVFITENKNNYYVPKG